MILKARILTDVADANHFAYAEQAEFMEGDTPTIYFQIVDDSVEPDLRPRGRRYLPVAGAVCQVTMQSIVSGNTIVRECRMAFPDDDRSIFCFDILSTDIILGTRNLKLLLTESTSIGDGLYSTKLTHGFVEQGLVVRPANPEF